MNPSYYTPKTKNIWFSSDFHGFHKNICAGTSNWPDKTGCRPFDNPELMTKTLVDNVNSVVEPQDLLIHTGDWSFGGIDNIERLRSMINCRNVVHIVGNHDKHIRQNPLTIQKLFTYVDLYNEFRINKTLFCIFHYPVISWNEIGKGSVMIHGHCHHSLQPQFTLPRMIDVGIDGKDYDFKPIHIDTIVDMIKDRETNIVDHHTKETNYG